MVDFYYTNKRKVLKQYILSALIIMFINKKTAIDFLYGDVDHFVTNSLKPNPSSKQILAVGSIIPFKIRVAGPKKIVEMLITEIKPNTDTESDSIIKPKITIYFEPYTQNLFTYFHGSNQSGLKLLEPRVSHLSPKSSNKTKIPVVFATISRYIAASFIPRWGDQDFIHGKHGNSNNKFGKWYMIEMYKNAFKLLDMEGSLYHLGSMEKGKGQGFFRTKELGLVTEYISPKPQKIIKEERVNVKSFISEFFTLIPWQIEWEINDLSKEVKYKMLYKNSVIIINPEVWNRVFSTNKWPLVVVRNGEIVEGLSIAQAAKIRNQKFAYIEQNPPSNNYTL